MHRAGRSCRTGQDKVNIQFNEEPPMKQRIALVAVTAVGLLTAGAVAAVSNASAATSGCSATYTVVSQWQGGFQGGVSFTNLGDPLSGWKLEFAFPDAGQ